MSQVKFTLTGNLLLVEPWLDDFSEVCTFTHRKGLYGAERFEKRKEYEYVKISMYNVSDKGNGTTYAVLSHRLVRFCTAKKIAYDFRDLNPALPVLSAVLPGYEYRTGQQDAVQAVLDNPRGIVKGVPAYGKSEMVGVLCRIFSTQRILVTTRSKQVINELAERYKNAPGKVTICNATHPFKLDSRIVICSDMSLHKVPDDWPEVLFFDEIHHVGAAVPSSQLSRFQKARMYGLSATPKGRSDGSNMVAEAFFGKVICTVDYQEAVAGGNVSPVEVRMVPVGGTDYDSYYDRTKAYATKINLERHGIWRNYERNMAVKKAVDKLLAEKIGKILILATTAEHCYYLKKLLPYFTAVHSEINPERVEKLKAQKVFFDTDNPKPDLADIKKRFRDGDLDYIVATGTLKEGVDFPNLRALIRVDGLSGEIPSIQSGGRVMRVFEGKEKGVIVDFTDNFGTQLERRSNARRQQYRKAGWEVKEWPI